MASTDPVLASNNPFRRRTTAPQSSEAEASASSKPASGAFFDGTAFNAPSSGIQPPPTSFRSATAGGEVREEETLQAKPKKIVKKVRVQSPPPSSPDDVIPVRSYEDDRDDGSLDSDDVDSAGDKEPADPFDSGIGEQEPVAPEQTIPRAPPNPFSKTLQDMENTAPLHDFNTNPASKGSLDVDSFRRLLLTGQANNPTPSAPSSATPATAPVPPLHDGASNTDASSISRQSIFDAMQETPRTSHEISEPEESDSRQSTVSSRALSAVPPLPGRKKPPPPSSRHGKLIKIELGGSQGTPVRGDSGRGSMESGSNESLPARRSSGHSFPPLQPSPSTSDKNKPLPLPPYRVPGEEDVDSPFDQEAAGKLPESFDATMVEHSLQAPSSGVDVSRERSGSHGSTNTTSSTRKPAAPPPRRQGKLDSKFTSTVANPASPSVDDDPPRSSLDSNRSHADSLRVNISVGSAGGNLTAPAPPPPRRPNHARSGSYFTSPSAGSFTSVSSPGTSDDARSPGPLGFNALPAQPANLVATITVNKDGQPKLSPPPPPPARHASTRRQPSTSSLDTTTGSITARPARQASTRRPLNSQDADLGGDGAVSGKKLPKEKDSGTGPPPPPPRRARGSSRGSLDGPGAGVPRRTSAEVERLEEEEPVSASEPPASAVEMMKELEALKREVDAARGITAAD